MLMSKILTPIESVGRAVKQVRSGRIHIHVESKRVEKSQPEPNPFIKWVENLDLYLFIF